MNKTIKAIMCIILCVVMFVLGACTVSVASADQTFPLKIWGQNTNGCYHTSVVVDDDTGVNYVVVSAQNYSNALTISITPRLNADGTPYTSK